VIGDFGVKIICLLPQSRVWIVPRRENITKLSHVALLMSVPYPFSMASYTWRRTFSAFQAADFDLESSIPMQRAESAADDISV
jgi:hypothetical protein